MFKKMHLLLMGLVTISFIVAGCDKEVPTSSDESLWGPSVASILPRAGLKQFSPNNNGPTLLDPTPLEPGWTVSTFVSGLFSPANGLEFDQSTGGFYVGEFDAGRVTFVDAEGNPSFFATVPSVDEMALNRTSTFLFAKEHNSGGPIHMFNTQGTFLGNISIPGFPTGTAFDSRGNFYVSDATNREVLVYPASTLPPNTPVASVYATGFLILEGMRFDSQDNLFVTEFEQGNVLQVVPPNGPHITWVSGQNIPINVAFDPCTNNLFVSNNGSGTILRVTSPGVFTTFAIGLSSPFAIVFDAVGNLYVNEFDAGRITKFTSPNPCFEVIEVDIDIKPGSDPNSINCNNKNEVIAVAILTTDDFDATTVDHSTVMFEGASETHVNRRNGEPRRHEEDVDGDGDTDLVVHFRLGETNLTCDSTEGTLTGETFDGRVIEGTDSVRMVGRWSRSSK